MTTQKIKLIDGREAEINVHYGAVYCSTPGGGFVHRSDLCNTIAALQQREAQLVEALEEIGSKTVCWWAKNKARDILAAHTPPTGETD